MSYFPFWFEGWIWVLIAPVPDLCIRFTFVVSADELSKLNELKHKFNKLEYLID